MKTIKLSKLSKLFEKKANELLEGGLADNIPASEFDPEQLDKGIKHEMEHTTNPAIAEEIAKDHLSEVADYYNKIEKLED